MRLLHLLAALQLLLASFNGLAFAIRMHPVPPPNKLQLPVHVRNQHRVAHHLHTAVVTVLTPTERPSHLRIHGRPILRQPVFHHVDPEDQGDARRIQRRPSPAKAPQEPPRSRRSHLVPLPRHPTLATSNPRIRVLVLDTQVAQRSSSSGDGERDNDSCVHLLVRLHVLRRLWRAWAEVRGADVLSVRLVNITAVPERDADGAFGLE
ncbi:hypothetical protein HK101_002896, partial [Irineochytrium annulatum]